jgi:hypothetical protein
VRLLANNTTAFLETGHDTRTICSKGTCHSSCPPLPGCQPEAHCCDDEEEDVEDPWSKVPQSVKLGLIPEDGVTNTDTFSYKIECPLTSDSVTCDMCKAMKYALMTLSAVTGPFAPLFGVGFVGASLACENCS